MKFSQPNADIFLASHESVSAALKRVTHLCVAAHQDDIEIMAYAGIAECRRRKDAAFGGVVVTNGAGSPRTGSYANLTDEQMQNVRRDEQRKAAQIGGYAVQVQLAHPSSQVKKKNEPAVVGDLKQIFSACRPEVLYLHQPADKHDTHIAVLARALDALRSLPHERRPTKVLGCEVWRDLDWLVDADKVALDASDDPKLALELLNVFDSQISGGKRYDLATMGRRSANATFHTSHATDRMSGITWSIDLTPLIRDDHLSIESFIVAHIDRLREDVVKRVRAF
ncbi:MAG TPA: PIG-L family deacetylase [Opitutaceae bacterium]